MASPARPYTVLDVFTVAPLAGNALAVVHDDDGVSSETMRRFAIETSLSETSFIQSPAVRGADYRHRIWTVAGEIPFAGHPSLGAAVAMTRARGAREAHFVQQTGAGLQPVDVRIEGDRAQASMLQEPATFGAEVDAGAVMAAVGLEADAAVPGLPPQVVSTGLPALIAPVASQAALARADADFGALDELMCPHEVPNLYLAHWEPGAGRARARMFSRLVKGGEDPATGSAAGPLCAYLARRTGSERVEIAQGVEMGRPSRLVTALEGERVRVGGCVVAIVDGELRL